MRRALLASLFFAPLFAQAAETVSMDVYRDPNCGCCKAWISHLRDNGIQVNDHVENDMASVKARLGVPHRLGSCHTGVIDGKFVEGHVPARTCWHCARARTWSAPPCRACPWARRAWRWTACRTPTR